MKKLVVPKRRTSNLRKLDGVRAKRTRIGSKTPSRRAAQNTPPPTPGNTSITDLPIEILEKIFGFADFSARQAMRATCKCLRNVHDGFLEHKCKELIYKDRNCGRTLLFQPRLLLKEFCKIIYENTVFFRKLKVFPLFLTIFLSYSDLLAVRGLHSSVIAKISNAKFISDVSDVFEKLMRNYLKIAQSVASGCCNKTRIIMILTILHLLNNCPTAKLKRKLKSQNYLEYEYVLNGAWLGSLWSKNNRTSLSLQIILVILVEMLTSIQMQQSFRKVIDVEESVIVFGNDIHYDNPKLPVSKFQFHVNSDKDVIEFMDTILKSGNNNCLKDDDFCLVDNLRLKKFYFALDVTCQEARKWGCSDSYIIYR